MNSDRLITYARGLLADVDAAPSFERKRAILAVQGYPYTRNEHELGIVLKTIRKAVYPGRTGGIH